MRATLVLVLAVGLGGCADKDNSSVTDKATRDLTNAQSAVGEKGRDVVSTAADIERRKRELAAEQQALAERERSLSATQQQLGSARESLVQARESYRVAITVRFTKLDAAIAERTAKADAASKDAAVGLRARRDALATKLAAMQGTRDEGWAAYARDVDTTFDAIERDLAN